jgi:hypothetical protein
MLKRAAFYEMSWQTIDRAIVNGLRLARRPIPACEVGERCHVARLCTEQQLRESLARLEERRLIRACKVRSHDAASPLFPAEELDAYEAVGGAL